MVDPLCDPFCGHNRIIFNLNTVFCLTIVKGLVKLSIVLIILEILMILIIINIMPKSCDYFGAAACHQGGEAGLHQSKEGHHAVKAFTPQTISLLLLRKCLLSSKHCLHKNLSLFLIEISRYFFHDSYWYLTSCSFLKASLSHVHILKTLTMTKMMMIASKRHAAHCQHVHSVCLVGQHQLFHFLKTLAPPKGEAIIVTKGRVLE